MGRVPWRNEWTTRLCEVHTKYTKKQIWYMQYDTTESGFAIWYS